MFTNEALKYRNCIDAMMVLWNFWYAVCMMMYDMYDMFDDGIVGFYTPK